MIEDIPLSFEDGHIVGYRALLGKLELEFECWNEARRTLIFEGYVGLRDNGAVGVIAGGMTERIESDFLKLLSDRLYEVPPADSKWRQFKILDLDDQPMLEVVAESCSVSIA